MMSAVRVESGPDAGAVWHHGDPYREQRTLEAGRGSVDLSHHDVLTLTGPDRLELLHALTTQHLTALPAGRGTTALVLSPHGHVEHVLYGVDDGETFWARTEPGAAAALVAFLDSMKFMMRVEIADRSSEYGIVWRAGAPESAAPDGAVVRVGEDSLGGHELFVPRAEIAGLIDDDAAGTWAYEALRIAAGVPRIGVDTDHRTLPNELGVLGVAVHLDKGCYRGQEAVARVHNLGKPPRRLTRLLLDGSVDALPEVGAELTLDGKVVGRVGSSQRHHELGPIALAMVKRATPVEATLVTGEIAASQEVLVDPDVGLHVRARMG